jgi:hypothetical protein
MRTILHVDMAPLLSAAIAGAACGGSASVDAPAGADASLADAPRFAATGDSAPSDALVLQIGDGSSVGAAGVFDCALAVSDNCWKTTVLAAADCLPPSSEMGTLSADGLTCTYSAGMVVTFASPLVIGPSATVSTFTVTTGGEQCLHNVLASNGSTLTTSAGSATLLVSEDSQTVTLGCPNGATYAGTFATLNTCEAGTIPGYDEGEGFGRVGDAAYNGHVTVTLEDSDSNSSNGLQVFDCASPGD